MYIKFSNIKYRLKNESYTRQVFQDSMNNVSDKLRKDLKQANELAQRENNLKMEDRDYSQIARTLSFNIASTIDTLERSTAKRFSQQINAHDLICDLYYASSRYSVNKAQLISEHDIIYEVYKYERKSYGLAISYNNDEIVSIQLLCNGIGKDYYYFEFDEEYLLRYANGEYFDPYVDNFNIYTNNRATKRVMNKDEEIVYIDVDKNATLSTIKKQIEASNNEVKEYITKNLPSDLAINISQEIDEITKLINSKYLTIT